MSEGHTFEKAGINRSVVAGTLSEEAARRLQVSLPAPGAGSFFAAGVSLVIHPRSPRIPTVHLNVRYFEIAHPETGVVDAWFGGGTDLTPMVPDEGDARHFHRALRAVCDAHHPAFHPRFKAWCDEYFRNTHRDGEARGVGGIFFDHLRPTSHEGAPGFEALLAFVLDVGRSLHASYAPLVERHRDTPFTDVERALQLNRRARYVEFNLLHDRGTHFGLQTGARTESVLMSLPPLASWSAPASDAYRALEERLARMLVPRDWASD
jgi:coproporphyrinogen III oxidase